MKCIIFLWFFLIGKASFSQSQLNDYLSKNTYSFSLEKGFGKPLEDVLKQKLKSYRVIIQGEGGSHYLKFYNDLRLVWLEYLSNEFGLRHFFMEFGHSSALLCNKFLETLDSTFLPNARFTQHKYLWKELADFNHNKTREKQLSVFGIDFERPHSYCKALKLLVPNVNPSKNIEPAIKLIKECNDTLYDCPYVTDLNLILKKYLEKNELEFDKLFGSKMLDIKKIVFNTMNCKDSANNRNKKMVNNFMENDREMRDPLYFGQLGMAHTVFSNKNFASLLNNTKDFDGKVGVINIYCYDCFTPEEQVVNWQLSAIESDIKNKLLKFCTSEFTFFDFTGDGKEIEKFKKYGQFLIVAKNQH